MIGPAGVFKEIVIHHGVDIGHDGWVGELDQKVIDKILPHKIDALFSADMHHGMEFGIGRALPQIRGGSIHRVNKTLRFCAEELAKT